MLSGVLQFEADAGFAQSGEQRDDLSEILNYASALHHGAREPAGPKRRLTLRLLRGLHGIFAGRRGARTIQAPRSLSPHSELGRRA